MKNPILVSTTFANRPDAEKMAVMLLKDRLIACGQITGPVTSSYWWKGSITTSIECILSMKTTAAHYERLEMAIRASHPYEVPEIVAVPITHLSGDYREWMERELGD